VCLKAGRPERIADPDTRKINRLKNLRESATAAREGSRAEEKKEKVCFHGPQFKVKTCGGKDKPRK
jgi:hypothetical protein